MLTKKGINSYVTNLNKIVCAPCQQLSEEVYSVMKLFLDASRGPLSFGRIYLGIAVIPYSRALHTSKHT